MQTGRWMGGIQDSGFGLLMLATCGVEGGAFSTFEQYSALRLGNSIFLYDFFLLRVRDCHKKRGEGGKLSSEMLSRISGMSFKINGAYVTKIFLVFFIFLLF